ncbi:MAG TPA: aldo/keto reductase [Candidatus Binataceae bacterium]|nr:aldo/keto reductase [Candidatus Binataceae bacterium]
MATKFSPSEQTMEYRQVGKSGLHVSAFGLGCNPFGAEVDEATAVAIVNRALELEISFFDTADSYNRGRSEEFLGKALRGRRHQAIIATKFGNPVGPRESDRGASRQHIIAACEASLRRLQTDYIDLYQVHEPDRRTPIEESMGALDNLVRQGKVRYLGASNFFEWEVCEAQWTAQQRGWNGFVLCQDFYNLLYRDIEKRMVPFCIKYGLGMDAYLPLAGGLLTGTYRRGQAPPQGSRGASRATFQTWISDRNWDVQEKLMALAQSRGWSLPQMALAWLLTRPMMATIIAGADSPAHLEANLKALDVRFTPADLAEIDRLTLVEEDRTVAPVYRVLHPERFQH